MTNGLSRTSLLLRLTAWIIISVANASPDDRFLKPHYTEAHHDLHRLVREITHPHLQDFEIVLPELRDNFEGRRIRKKRDIFAQDELDMPRFKVSSHGHDFDIELTPNTQLLTKNFSVDIVGNGLLDVERRHEDLPMVDFDCHHIGRMISHENRTAAISTCRGLTGILRTEEDDFIIEPVPSHLPHDFQDSEPHIIYKKRHLTIEKNDHGPVCGKRRHNPIPTAIEDGVQVEELSNGEVILVEESEKMREEIRKKLSRERHKRGDPRRPTERKRKIVETLVVADRALVEKHVWGLSDVTTYVLTVMNMVSGLFKDASLDEKIDIVIVGLILLEDDKEFHLDHRADKSLSNFCRWQGKLNTTSGRRPDHAILLTGTDICADRNQPCDTLGLAQIGGMCTRASCTINEDSGLGVAFTIAHETGHSFGMKHDGSGNSCSKSGHIMSPSLDTVNGVFTWSACSRKSMAKFIRSGRARCLYDEPPLANVTMPGELPGVQYNATLQCKLQYGLDSQVCEERYFFDQEAICKSLWCLVDYNGLCRTKHVPPAEGTTCGRHKWCRRGHCVSRGSAGPAPVDGVWSRYGPWSDCSRTCGRGVSFKQRFCNRPAPRHGGRYCEGEEKIYRICNPHNCPPDAQTYRAQQCARHNSRPYRRQYFSWIPFTKYWKYGFDKCELFCKADGYGFFDKLSSQVKDGTPCDEESNDVCIDGQCMHVGCDFVLNSHATVDACGVCEGDNSTCKFISGSFRDRLTASGYFHVVRIPQGARTVKIWEERCCTRSFIAARSATNRTNYFLNGNWRVNIYGTQRFAGTKWNYLRPRRRGDVLSTDGPLSEDVEIEILSVRRNPGVSYTYAMKEIDNALPHESVDNPPQPTYSWKESFSPCSKSCGGGIQRSESECIKSGENVVVGDDRCDESSRPDSTRQCNTQSCPAKWIAEDWETCSRTCGGGVQVRRILCKRQSKTKLENVHQNECDSSPKPQRRRSCSNNLCLPQWKATRWGKCSRTCGPGVHGRLVYCRSGRRRLPSAKCGHKPRPASRQTCTVKACRSRFTWSLGNWGRCSATCGSGMQHRMLKCTYKDSRGRLRLVFPRRCASLGKPRYTLRRSCSNPTCSPIVTRSMARAIPTTKKPPRTSSRRFRPATPRGPAAVWVSSSWQDCTRSCDGGQQVRAVKCMQDGKPSVACSYSNKPPNIRSCNTNSCSRRGSTAGTCVDHHTWCHLVPQHKTCSHFFFGKQCCKSCTRAKSKFG